jgi:hypothetical protein
MQNVAKKWTNEELEYLYTERLKGTPYKIISAKLNRSIKAIETKYNKDTDWSKYQFHNSDAELERKNAVAKQMQKNDMSISRSFDRYRIQADIVGDRLVEAARNLPAAPPPVYKPKQKNLRTAEDMGLMFSDLHIGHEHTLEETGGLSEYNVDIFHKRLENLKVAITDIYELHSKLYKIPTLHIFSLGDIVDGANTAGAWSPVWINTPVYDQVMIGYRSISDFIYYMLTIFDNVELYGFYGNHGRIAPNGAEKKYNNFDFFCYKYIELEMRNQPRFKMHAEKTWWAIKRIQNHNFLLTHGDELKAKNAPAVALSEHEKKVTGLTGIISDYSLCGHFHNCSEYTTHSGKAIVNGSFVGQDVYSLSNSLPGKLPEQKLFGIHPKIGITWTYNVNLNHRRS